MTTEVYGDIDSKISRSDLINVVATALLISYERIQSDPEEDQFDLDYEFVENTVESWCERDDNLSDKTGEAADFDQFCNDVLTEIKSRMEIDE